MNLNLVAVINQINFSWPQRINLDVVVDCHWSMTPFVIILRIFRNIVESWLLDYSFFADIAPEIRASKRETSFGQSGSCKRKPFSSKTIWSTLPAHCSISCWFWKTQCWLFFLDCWSLHYLKMTKETEKVWWYCKVHQYVLINLKGPHLPNSGQPGCGIRAPLWRPGIDPDEKFLQVSHSSFLTDFRWFWIFPHFDGQVLPILLKLDPDSLLNCGRASSRLFRLVSDWEVWAS